MIAFPEQPATHQNATITGILVIAKAQGFGGPAHRTWRDALGLPLSRKQFGRLPGVAAIFGNPLKALDHGMLMRFHDADYTTKRFLGYTRNQRRRCTECAVTTG
jgi:hypothetical protein